MKKILLSLTLAGLGLAANSNAQTYSLQQTFETCTGGSVPTGWTAATMGGGAGWVTTNAAVSMPSIPTSIPGHTTFAYVSDANSPHNHPATLTTNTFTASTSSNFYLVFDSWFQGYYYSSPFQEEKAWVDISLDGGTTWSIHDTIPAAAGWSTNSFPVTVTSGATCQLRFCYSDEYTGTAADSFFLAGAAIDNIYFGTPAAEDIAITSVTPIAGDPSADFALTNTGHITLGGTAYNNGYTTVSSFTATYQVGSGAPVNTSVTGVSIAPFTSYTFTCTPAYTMPASTGPQNAKVYLTLSGDTNHTNDTMSTVVNAVSSFPYKIPFFEEPTGVWCGFCVRGLIYMDSLWKAYPGMVSISSVHDDQGNPVNDGMCTNNTTTTDYDHYITSFPSFTGFPGLIADRYYNAQDPADAFTWYNALSTEFAYANMKLTTSITGSNVVASVKVTPAIVMNGDYRLELIITEDSVHGTGSNYSQHNYYSGGGYGALQDAEYNFVTLPNPVPASEMYYPFVDRYTVPDLGVSPNGVAGSLPSTMASGTTYSYDFTSVAIDPSWNGNHLHAIVLLIDNNSTSNTYNMVLNSINTHWTVGVANVEAGIEGVRVFPNPATEQTNVVFNLDNDANVTINIYDALGRTVSSNSHAMTSGTQHVTIPVSGFASGVYNVVIGTENGTVSERFTVVR